MLLLIILVSALLYPIDSFSLNTAPSSTNNEPQTSADLSSQYVRKTDKQPAILEGQFIIAEGNSDHLFRPYDFLKEDAVQLAEGDTKDTKADDDKVSV